MLAPLALGGTYSAFLATARWTHSRNSFSGTAGMATNEAECCMRFAFSAGRKMWMLLSSGLRSALRPS